MIVLNCPKCGGNLEIPDNLDVAHCLYCGAKVLLREYKKTQGENNFNQYIELLKATFDAKNYEESIQYCNKVLEIDTKNIDAWITKAISTFWLSTPTHNRFEESMSYLQKASVIIPDDSRIGNAKAELTNLQVDWLNKQGEEEFEHAKEINNSYKHKPINSQRAFEVMAQIAVNYSQAKKESKEYFIKSMESFIKASNLSPSDTVSLKNIVNTAQEANWIEWTEEVKEKIKKGDANEKLIILKNELQKCKDRLKEAKIKRSSNNFFERTFAESEEELMQKIERIQSDIKELEK